METYADGWSYDQYQQPQQQYYNYPCSKTIQSGASSVDNAYPSAEREDEAGPTLSNRVPSGKYARPPRSEVIQAEYNFSRISQSISQSNLSVQDGAAQSQPQVQLPPNYIGFAGLSYPLPNDPNAARYQGNAWYTVPQAPPVTTQPGNLLPTSVPEFQVTGTHWNNSQRYQEALQSASLQRSVSAGDLMSHQQVCPTQCNDSQQNGDCQGNSMNALPTAFLFGSQAINSARPRVARSSSLADGLSTSSDATDAFPALPIVPRPPLSVYTDNNTLEGIWRSTVDYDAAHQMQLSDVSSSFSHLDGSSSQPAVIFAGHQSQAIASGDSQHNTSQSGSSSLPSTPELSRQQSSSSFRSPATDYSQLQGSLPPSSHSSAVAANSNALKEDEHPVPELISINLKEKTAALDTWARLPSRPNNDAEANALIRPHIIKYLQTPNKLLLGERTVVIMSTSLGQKSYGSERRFMVPPPCAFILGASWWTHLPDAYVPGQKQDHSMNKALQVFAPSFEVTVVQNREVASPFSEWTTYAGKIIRRDVADAEDLPIAGRVVGKHLFVPHDIKDDKDKHGAQALVSVISPGLGRVQDRTIGNFASKPIKIISKPSKTTQMSKKGSHYVLHGSTISLFSRLRSQTVSTRFLCVSGAGASFPMWDWQSMSGDAAKPFSQEEGLSFKGRTSSWDAFVIYAVDPRRPFGEEPGQPPQPPALGFPAPPPNALPVPSGGQVLPIHYNQPVLLQCMNTGFISPIMIIRRVEQASTAHGNSTTSPYIPGTMLDLPSAPQECLGEPVSQLHKIALEVMPDPEAAYSAPINPEVGFLGGGSYLSCVGEEVGCRKAVSNRSPVSRDISTAALGPDASEGLADSTPGSSSMSSASRSRSKSLVADNAEMDGLAPATNDGGKVKKLRRATSSINQPISRPSAGGRRRGLSSASALIDANGDTLTEGAWTQDVGEAGVWVVASIDITRHTFYIPPNLFDGLTPFRCKATHCPDWLLTPIPSIPLSNMPIVRKHIISVITPGSSQARRMGIADGYYRLITLYGENLGPEWTVWIGDAVSPYRAESACSEVLECLEPARGELVPSVPRHILLVRTDGVIMPTHVYWRP